MDASERPSEGAIGTSGPSSPLPEDPDLAAIRALDALFKPLPPEELERRNQLYRGAGTLDPESIMQMVSELGMPPRAPLEPYAPWDAEYSRRALS